MTPEESRQAALAEQVVDKPVDNNSQAEQQAGHNPNWDEAWVDVPEPIREAQKAVFAKWDNDYQLLAAKHKPYAEYEQNGVDEETLANAVNVYNGLVNDPHGFWEQIGTQWGFTPAETKVVADAAAAAGIDADNLEDATAKEIRELKQLVQDLGGGIEKDREQQQTFAQQQQEAQAETARIAAIDKSFTDLQAKVGATFTDEQMEEIAERAILNATLGRSADIEVAYREIQKIQDRIISTVKAAPKLLGGTGSASAPAPAEPGKIPTTAELLVRAMAEAKSVKESFATS